MLNPLHLIRAHFRPGPGDGDSMSNPQAPFTPSSTVTTRSGQTLNVPLLCPVRKGQQLIIPAGSTIRRRGVNSVSKRTQSVTVFSAFSGYLTEGRDGMKLVPPMVSWAGSGGYWADCNVTAAVLEANGFTAQVNTDNLHTWRHHFVPAAS